MSFVYTPLTRRFPRYDLYQIIRQMENPEVRLEDNTAYRIDAETLGILYAYAVSQSSIGNSPGLLLAKLPVISPTALRDQQRSFQEYTRGFLYRCLGALVVRAKTAAELKNGYIPSFEKNLFAPGTLEHLVTSWTQENRFTAIGENVKAGAQAYHHRILGKHQRTYHNLASEYTSILTAFRRQENTHEEELPARH